MKLCKGCKYFEWYLDVNPAYDSSTCSFPTLTKREVPIEPVHGNSLYSNPRSCAAQRMHPAEYDDHMMLVAAYYDLCGFDGKHYEPREAQS